MRIPVFYAFLITSLFLISCSTKTIQELSEEQEKEIINAISAQWEYGRIGLEERDAELLFNHYSESDDAKIIAYGTLYPDIEVLQKQFIEAYTTPVTYKRKVTFDPVYYDFINEKVVLMTTIGSAERIYDTISNMEPDKVAYSVLWIKESNEWKVFHMHASK